MPHPTLRSRQTAPAPAAAMRAVCAAGGPAQQPPQLPLPLATPCTADRQEGKQPRVGLTASHQQQNWRRLGGLGGQGLRDQCQAQLCTSCSAAAEAPGGTAANATIQQRSTKGNEPAKQKGGLRGACGRPARPPQPPPPPCESFRPPAPQHSAACIAVMQQTAGRHMAHLSRQPGKPCSKRRFKHNKSDK